MGDYLLGTYQTKDKVIDLQKVMVIGRGTSNIPLTNKNIKYSLDNVCFFDSEVTQDGLEINFSSLVARYLKFEDDITIKLYQGEGYIGSFNKEWTDLFVTDMGWTGGDGLFTFNLKGIEQNNLSEKDVKTLCVFGDTFFCTKGCDLRRLEPCLMPNNSYCVIDGINPIKEKTSFYVKQDDKGHYESYLVPNNDLSFQGCMANNLVNYSSEKDVMPFMSSYNPSSDIEIVFDFNDEYQLKSMDVYNYFLNSDVDCGYQLRGVKEVDVYYKKHGTFIFYKKAIIQKAEYENKGLNSTLIPLDVKTRYIKLVISNKIGKGNYQGSNYHEGLFGLNKVYFTTYKDEVLTDISVWSNNEYSKNDKHAWFWLQDGIIIKNRFYSLPLVVTSDPTQPDGFQFKVEGVSMISAPIQDEMPRFEKMVQKSTNLLRKQADKEYCFGCAFLNNTLEDGYIYIYGYTSSFFESEFGKRLIVARVKESKFSNINEWRYFNGSEFVSDILQSKPLVDHVSCENSVFKDGDKYICIFTYDVKSKYLAYSLADTPYGPFGQIRICYVCTENTCEHLYQYNGKGHLHLSKTGNILASYNVNTSDFGENMKYSSVYGPRFVNLIKKGDEHESKD